MEMSKIARSPTMAAMIPKWTSQRESLASRGGTVCAASSRLDVDRTRAVKGGLGGWWRGATDGSAAPRSRSERLS